MESYKHNKYFNKTCFIDSIFDIQKLPKDATVEIVFAGRSNSGKSTIINTLANQKTLAIASKKPGKTKSINYFKVEKNKYLIDLPGYGYARVAKDVMQFWQELLENFFVTRKSIKGVVLIMDIRHPLKPFDKQMMLLCAHHYWPMHIVLNKSDQLNKQQIYTTTKMVANEVQSFVLASFQTFSALSKQGVEELQKKLMSWCENQ
jgi:GTP-binding protein